MRTSLRAVLVGGLLIGCSLSITRLTFDLPKQTYNLDTSMWGNLPPAAAGATFPSVPCTDDASCCTLAATADPGLSCQTTPLTCPAGTCEGDIPESVNSSINLAMQVPTLATFPGHSLLDVTISSITYEVTNNTLNVDLPPMQIYLAPDGITDPKDPSATLFGTVPSIPAGTNPTGMVQKTSNADAVFMMYTKNVSTPFNVIGATTVVIKAGDKVPNGHLTVTIGGSVSAQL